jgi:carbohydrate kinase (thermoresistant glucokinase family)
MTIQARDNNKGTAWVVMGVSGCGKSSIGAKLALELGVPFIEGDAFHSQANVAKMSAGIPLTDDDRRDWLLNLRDKLAAREGGAVLSCSSLKRAYRDLLRSAGGDVRFAHLAGPREVLLERVSNRPGHYMPPSLLDSQLSTLEPLQPDEAGITLDIRDSQDQLVAQILASV